MFIYKVAEALKKERVKFAVAGGYAVALHGAVRGTLDLDIVIERGESSFIGAEKALGNIGLVSRLPVTASEVFRFREEYIKNRNLVAWSFWNPAEPSEIVDIVITEDLKKMDAATVKADGHLIPVLSRESLIAMKRRSARPQDLEDIRALEELK